MSGKPATKKKATDYPVEGLGFYGVGGPAGGGRGMGQVSAGQRPGAAISVERGPERGISMFVRSGAMGNAQPAVTFPSARTTDVSPIENDAALGGILEQGRHILQKHIGPEADTRRWRDGDAGPTRKGIVQGGGEQLKEELLDRTIMRYKPGEIDATVPINDYHPLIDRPDGQKSSYRTRDGKLALQVEFPDGIFEGEEKRRGMDKASIRPKKFTFVFEPAPAIGSAEPRIGRLSNFFIGEIE